MALKLRVLTKFPALVEAATGLAVSIANGIYTFALDLLAIDTVDSVADLTTRYLLMVSDDDGDGEALYERISLEDFRAVTQGYEQIITDPGPADINATTRLVIVNQTVGAAITLNLPAASAKIGPVKIVDWKGDAATNPITIVPDGSETLNGALTSWTISGNNGSVVLDPYSSNGYAV